MINSSRENAAICIAVAVVDEPVGEGVELSCILVPKNTPGLETRTVQGKLGLRAAEFGDVIFHDCRVSESHLLGECGRGVEQQALTLDHARLAFAAVALGASQGVYEQALKYAKRRMLYGKPLSKFQDIAFKLSKIACEIEAARNLLYQACRKKDADKHFRKDAAMARVFCMAAMRRASDDAIQIHGANGLMNEFGIERFYRDYKALSIGIDPLKSQNETISHEIGCYI